MEAIEPLWTVQTHRGASHKGLNVHVVPRQPVRLCYSGTIHYGAELQERDYLCTLKPEWDGV